MAGDIPLDVLEFFLSIWIDRVWCLSIEQTVMYFHHFISKDMHRYFIRILGSLQLLIICLYKQEVDPCKSITDEDIRTTIQNSGGPKGAMFLPEVCFWLDYVWYS